MRPISCLCVFVVVVALLPRGAAAQATDTFPGRFDVAGGVRWTGEASFGASDATETAPDGSRYRLFATSTTLGPSTGAVGSVALRLTRSIEAGLSTSFATSMLGTRISSDVEGIPDGEVTEALTELAIEGSLVVHLLGWRLGERVIPFISAGGGQLRHLHEGQMLVEKGAIFHAGAGLTYLLRSAGLGALKATGVRVEARGVGRAGGAAFDNGLHVAPAFGASLFVRY